MIEPWLILLEYLGERNKGTGKFLKKQDGNDAGPRRFLLFNMSLHLGLAFTGAWRRIDMATTIALNLAILHVTMENAQDKVHYSA